ncbi:hemagglutinin repeat-containing protein [Collimonas fungivorans]|nr:hemagglutinin repeat-containing protein [Collimonas fungivorans]
MNSHQRQMQQQAAVNARDPSRPALSERSWMRRTAKTMLALYLCQTVLAVLPAQAGNLPIAASPNAPAGQRPLIDGAQNGVPIVLIAPPSASGVSRNQYGQFNVNPNGLILNNSSGNTQTQLGGWITGNPQLGNTPARIILNEVVSNNPSQLRGTIEVAGQRANIVVANPNGITCDGCGFLNANRGTLTTGQVQFGANGAINGFNVGQGQLTIGSGGLNASNIEQLDLIARGLVIEGEVWAKNLNALAGANQVLYGTLQTTPQVGTGAAPRFAIDIKDLGGMYANQVYLVSTEQGLGVNSSGRVAALQGNLVLSSNGDLTLKDSYAKQNIQLAANGNTVLIGQTQSEGSTTIASGGSLAQQGTLDSQGQLIVNAGALSNSGSTIQRSADNLTLAINGVAANSGSIASGGALNLNAAGITDSGGKLLAAGDLNLQALNLSFSGSQLNSDKNVNLTASAGNLLASGSNVAAGNNLNVSAGGQLSNAGGIWQAGQNASIQAASVSNVGGTLLANGQLGVTTAGKLDNSGGKLMGSQAVALNAQQLVNDANGLVASDLATRISATQGISNQGGMLSGKTDLTVDANGAAINNTAGTLVSDASLNVSAGALDNSRGQLTARAQNGGAATLNLASLSNRQGVIDAAGSLALSTSGAIDNTQGSIASGTTASAAAGGAQIQSASLTNNGGQVIARDTLAINTGALGNDAIGAGKGILASNKGAVTINAGAASNIGGLVTSATGTTLNTQALNSSGGEISSGAALAINTAGQTLTNTGGRILANGKVEIQAGAVASNANGAQAALISSGSSLDIRASTLNNGGSVIVAGNTADASAGKVDLELGGGALSNNGGAIQSTNAMTINAGTVGNQSGQITANNTVNLNAASVDNTAGLVSAVNTLAVASAAAIQNGRGQLASNGNLSLSASTLDNIQGMVSAKQQADLKLGTGLLNNAGGQIVGTQALTVQSGEIRNAAGTIASGANLVLNTQGQAFDNSAGQVVASGNLDIASAQLNNSGGTIASLKGAAGINTGGQALTNDSGKIQAAGNTTLSAGNTSNVKGLISGQDITIAAATFDNAGAQVVAAGNLSTSTAALNNTQGLLQSVGNARIDSHGQAIVNRSSGNSGGIVSGGTLDVKGGSLDNQAGYVASNGKQTLAVAGDLDNRSSGQIVANGSNTITAANVLNSSGLIQSLGDIGITAAGSISNNGGQVAANGDAVLNAVNIDNSAAGNISATNIRASANSISNAGGNIKAGKDAVITTALGAASLDNTGGLVSAKHDVTINATALNNASGKIVGDNSATVTTSSNSLSGTIASSNAVTLNVNGDYNNTGLLSAQKTLTVNASNITNSGTLTSGDTLNVTAGNLTNSGEISAQTTNLNVSGTLTNSSTGLIDGVTTNIIAGTTNNSGRIYGDLLRISGGAVNNSGSGTIAARNTLLIGVQNLSNTEGGLIYSLGDLGIGGAIDGNGNLQGSVENLLNASAKIEAQGNLAITAASLVNRNNHLTTRVVVDPTINQDQVQPSGSATKYKSSDCFGVGGGGDSVSCIVHPDKYGQRSTVATARTVIPDSCSGSGDSQTCIPGSIVDNYPWNSPVFAQFGVATVTSAAPVEPNGGPGGCSFMTDNGSVDLTTPQCVQWRKDYAVWSTAYEATLDALAPKIDSYNASVREDNRLDQFEDYTWYKVTASSSHIEVTNSAPAQILSGGSMTLNGSVTNQDSQIVAGGALAIVGPTVRNLATQGESRTTYSGTAEFTHVDSCGTFGGSHCRSWDGAQPYNAAPQVISVDLPTVVYQQNAGNQTDSRNLGVSTANPDGSVAGAVSSAIGNARIIGAQAVNAVLATGAGADSIGRALPVVQSVAANGTGLRAHDVILTTPPRLILPNNSLFTIHPEPGSRYLVETDPRFTNQRNFLSSDYFLQALNRDPERNLKRYGDGFYEQQLINDQILALTGRRYLTSYTSTEDEYKALMNAGVAYANQYQLSPGVALSAEQMANLTTDIVWLVSRSVTLADGSTQQVLVPQVYLRRPQGGDLQQSGALIAGGDVMIKTDSDLVNSGSIAATNSTTLLAGNDLLNQGGRISGQDIVARARNDLVNLSGVIQGSGNDSIVTLLAGRDIVLQTRTIDTVNPEATSTRTNIDRIATVQGGTVTLNAARDLVVKGANVSAVGTASTDNPNGGNLIATAGRDVKVSAVTGQYQIDVENPAGHSVEGRTGFIKESTVSNQLASLNASNNLGLAAGQGGSGDLTLKGANLNAGNNALLSGSNVSIEAVKDSVVNDIQTVGKKEYHRIGSADETLVGGNVNAGNNLTVKATGTPSGATDASGSVVAQAGSGNITLTSAYLATTTGQVTLAANNDVTIKSATTEHSTVQESYVKSGDAMSTTTTTIAKHSSLQQAEGSTVSGNSVLAVAGHDINIQGSNVVGTKDVTLAAANNVNILTAQSKSAQSSYEKKETSGLFSTGASITMGSKEQDNENTLKTVTNTGSVIGSTGGNLTINAGEHYTQTGSRVVAPAGDISIAAKSVDINAAFDTSEQNSKTHTEQSGLSLGVSSPIVSALQSIEQMSDASKKTDDSRMKLLAAAAAAMTAKAVADAAANPSVTVSLTIGASKSDSQSKQTSSTAVGSSVAAGGNLAISATGADKDSNVNILGSNISAGKDASIKADGDINLQATQSTSDQHSTSSSSSAAVGIAATYGSNGLAFGVTANASGSRGKADGDDVTQNNTHVVAGNTLTLESGHDTNIKGGVASARQVIADVGTSGQGNLNIESLQDTSNYKSKDQSIGGSVTIGYGFAASGNYSQTKVNGSFASVGEQSGIAAGDGGFQVKVNGNTDLKGGVIASSDKAIQDNKNSLATQTLTQVDIKNHSDFDASGFGVSGGFGVGGDKGDGKAADGSTAKAPTVGGQTLQTFQTGSTGTSAGIGSASGSSSSTTRSGISGGVVTITDDAAQQAKTGTTAVQTVASINRDVSTAKDSSGALTKDWDGQKLKDDVSAQVQITSTFGQQAAKNIGDYAKGKEDGLRAQAQTAKNSGDLDGAAALSAEADKWTDGGAYRVALHTAAGALSGGLGGAAGALTSATAMNVIGDEIKKMDLPADLKQGLAQIAATALGAAIGGAAGAASGLNVEANNRQLHQDERQWAKDKAQQYQQYLAKNYDEKITAEEAYQRLLSAGYAMVDDAALVGGKSDEKAKQFISENKTGNLFTATAIERRDSRLGGNPDGSWTPEQQARFGAKTPGENASKLVTIATDYLGKPCGANCGAKFDAINNAVLALEAAKPLYQDDVGSITLINRQIELLKNGIGYEERVRGAAQSIGNTDKAIAAALLGGPSRIIAGNATADTLNTVSLVQQLKDLRLVLPSGPKTGGNMGIAQIDIPGIPSTMAASSQINTPTITQQALGFVGQVPETFTSSAVPSASGVLINRAVDSEAKILNNVAARLGDNTSVAGTINLLTERAPCSSCSNIIQQFQTKYPNIIINVMDNNGIVLRPPKKGL